MSDNIHHTEITELLQSYVKNTLQFSKNDPLANVTANGIIELHSDSLIFDLSWDKLAKAAKNIHKEFGINPTCTSQGLVRLDWKETYYQIPILLQEVKIHINKLTHEIILENFNDIYINPFLTWFFEREFDIKLPSSFEDLLSQLSSFTELELDNTKQYIGNFHPHRFEMLREIEQLVKSTSYSSSLSQILGLTDEDQVNVLPFSPNELVPTDPDQLAVLSKLTKSNCVVQGPPGTGKSQVILNVLGKLLELESSTLVVSEKRVALDVIQKKMASLGLDGLCYTSTQHFSTSNFIQELKKEWERLELMSSEIGAFSPINQLVQGNLQSTLNLLHQPKLGNGMTIMEFLCEYENFKCDSYSGYDSELPSLDEWSNIKPTVEFLFERDLNFLISQVKTELLDKSFLFSIETKIQQWRRSVSELTMDENTLAYKKLFELSRKSLRISKFNTLIFKKYGKKFIGKSSITKKLVKLKNDIQILRIDAEKSNLENTHWLFEPNKEEVTELINRFKNSSVFGAFSRNKLWKKWTRSPFLDPITSLNLRIEQLNINEKLQIKHRELLKFGIEDTTDLEEVIQLTQLISEEELKEFQTISLEERIFLEEKQGIIGSMISDFKLYFRFEDDIDLVYYLQNLERRLYLILEHVDTNIISSKHLSILARKYSNVHEIESAIMHSTWSKLKVDFPQLNDFSWVTFYQKITDFNTLCENERVDFANYILQKQKNKFDQFHTLLLTTSPKLSTNDKELKNELRVGKRILIKEFAKSKNHLSMRQLMDSPAKKWIQLLKPVWLMNPSRISVCFPLEQNIFSLSIFDEASQIPLESAFGALQRSERVLIAGDPQQMSPSSYFKAATESVDLLHQASFYLPSLFLSYHYRSYHPELISFSNAYFYQNRLSAFRDASYKEKPIQFNYIPEGRFDERTNKIEAKAVAEYISTRLASCDTLGIVAFSETQLQEIFDLLPSESKSILQEKIDADQVFFKSVENVQGDECDELIVSFGYGYSEKEGVFSHRFGPINLNSGAKRLNVLFTRARKKITFFASVQYDDFKPSSNESIEILRKWFRKLNEINVENETSKCNIHVKDIFINQKNILAIKSLLSIYKNRNWVLEVE